MSAWKSWATAATASVGLMFLVATASSCKFLSLSPTDLDGMGNRTDTDRNFPSQTMFGGLICQSDNRDDLTFASDDSMWILSVTFLSAALLFGCIATIAAWVVVYTKYPSPFLWLSVSVSAAFGAIFCVPVFLLFSTEACNQARCEIAMAAYFLLCSLFLWISLTIFTQCLDPPDYTDGDKQPLVSEPPIANGSNHLGIDSKRSLWDKACPRWILSLGAPVKDGPAEEQNLKFDRTMMEDDEEAYNHVVGSNLDEIEVTEAYAAALFMDTPTIPEYDANGDEEEENEEEENEEEDHEGINHSERTRVIRNYGVDTGYSYSVPEDAHERVLMTSLYSSSQDDANSTSDIQSMSQFDTSYDFGLINSAYTKKSPVTQSENEFIDNEQDKHVEDDPSATAIADYQEAQEGVKPNFVGAALVDMMDDDEEEEVERDKFDVIYGLVDEEKVENDGIDDLGSLEPTVMETTGDESILDRESSAVATSSAKEQGNVRAIVQKVIQSPMDLGLAVISRAKQTNGRRLMKGYRLMDDSDMSSSYPWSPPLEILTLNISRDSSLDPYPNDLSEKQQDLLDDWNAIHESAKPFTETFSDKQEHYIEPMDNDDDAHFQQEDHRIIPIDDYRRDMNDDDIPMTSNEGSRRRRRRGRRMHRSRGGRSVASSASFVSATIEEETAEDLDTSGGSDVETLEANDHLLRTPFARSRSAPALARFGRLKSETGNVNDNLKMTGIHSYHTAQIFRGTDESTKTSDKLSLPSNSTPGVSVPGQRRRICMIPPSSVSVPERKTNRRPAQKKVPLFREERANRAGMHTQSRLSDHSSSEDARSAISAPSFRSRQAREARLRRLQGQALSPRRSTTQERQTEAVPILNRVSPESLHVRKNGSRGSSDGQDNASFDSGNYMIDLLDVQLAQLNRPEGANIGPDEVSL